MNIFLLQYSLLKGVFFLYWIYPLLKASWPDVCRLTSGLLFCVQGVLSLLEQINTSLVCGYWSDKFSSYTHYERLPKVGFELTRLAVYFLSLTSSILLHLVLRELYLPFSCIICGTVHSCYGTMVFSINNQRKEATLDVLIIHISGLDIFY